MKRIIFVTESEDNFQSAKRYLDSKIISLVQAPEHTLCHPENNLQDMVAKKAMNAYEKVQEPCFVIESSFMIEALNQFPGTMMNDVLKTIGTDGLLKLMEGIENRSCVYRQTLGYYNGKEMLYFYSDIKGSLATKKAGDNTGNLLDQIFIPESYQMFLEPSHDASKSAHVPDCIEQFAHYLNTHLSTLIDEPYREN